MAFQTSEIVLAKIPTSSNTTLRSRSISTAEITVEPDLESGSSSVSCRICLEDDSIEGDELISPCLCKGAQQFVHRQCLDRWRSEKEGFAFAHCTTCKAGFQIQKKEVKYDILTRIKHKLFVAGDVFFGLLTIQIIIAVFGVSLFFVDYKGIITNLVISTILIIFICGVGYGIFLASMAVQRSWHRHYEILFKRDLTQVYVVVDQRGHYTPPILDPIVEQYLRSFNLL